MFFEVSKNPLVKLISERFSRAIIQIPANRINPARTAENGSGKKTKLRVGKIPPKAEQMNATSHSAQVPLVASALLKANAMLTAAPIEPTIMA